MVTYPIATVEQTTNDVIVFDQDLDWRTAASVKWRWSAAGGAGTAWHNLSDVRLRNTQAYGTVVLVCASGGRAAMLRLSTGRTVWQTLPGENPHAIERIPGGVLVVASSQPGRLRFYTDSTHIQPFLTMGLPGAHGALYDPVRTCLWVIGDEQLIRYTVTGSGAGTTLTVHSRARFAGLGHDVQPVFGDHGALWFTDSFGVYRLDIDTMEYEQADAGNGVKSYVSQPTGIRVLARADNAGPRAWGGPTIEFFDSSGRPAFTRTRPGAEFYT
ncbi:DUF6528 family protein, partial [Streptomyces sp. H27-D2]|uniref:DUF6528 family protein n=1 Tax=Streptomyces sp. H27-D2 TaxID=3046304 RepID=UPI002DB5D992